MNHNAHVIPQGAARVYGVAIILAPILLMASTIAYVVAGEGINHGVLGGVLGVWSCFAFIIGLTGVLRRLEPSAPRAAPALTLLALTGFAAGVGFNVQAIVVAVFGSEFEVLDAAAGADAVSLFAFLPWGWFVPLSLVLIGAWLWRTRTFAWWSGALLVAGGVLFVASRPERIEALAILADGVLVLALVPIGWALFTGRQAARVSSREPAPGLVA